MDVRRLGLLGCRQEYELTISQDGKPYIIQCSATKAIDDPRSQGYNLIAMTVFSSLDDMKYYDEQDEAHAALKAVGKGKVDPPPMVIYSEAASA